MLDFLFITFTLIVEPILVTMDQEHVLLLEYKGLLLTIVPYGFVAPTAYCASIRLAHIATKKIVYTWI
jgi:hypothetical protein